MKVLSDYDVYQNYLLGAQALWEFSTYYQEYHEEREAPVFMLTTPVLAIVFNKRATDCIKGKNFKEGSLIKVITENKDIYSGLQERMENTIEITYKSLFIATASKLVIYDHNTTQIIPRRKSEIPFSSNEFTKDYNDILSASRRIGAWFGQLNTQEITDFFNINF